MKYTVVCFGQEAEWGQQEVAILKRTVYWVTL
jgi:hypothetical protein